MYIEKTKTNKFKFIETYTDALGKRKKVSVTLEKNTKQAQNKAYEILQQKIQNNLDVFNVEYKFLDCLEKYIEYKKQTVRFSTFCSCIYIFKSIKNNAKNWKLKEIQARHLLSIFKEDELDLNKKFSVIKNFIKWCYKKDYLDDISFLQKIEFPKKSKDENKKLYLEKEEADEILIFFEHNELVYNMIKILLNTGLRIGELLALNYSDLNGTTLSINKTLFKNKVYNHTKTKTSKRDIEVNKIVIEAIHFLKKRQLNNKILEFKDDRIFSGVNEINYNSFFYELKKFKPIKLHPHLFRHTHASLLIERGISVEAVSRRLGHNDTKITQRIYIHLTNKLKEKEDKIFRELII